MSNQLKLAMAQLNLVVGDIPGNLAKHIAAATYARDTLGADVIVFPELSLTGYPPEDLLLRPGFLAEADKALQQLCTDVKNIYCLVGHPALQQGDVYNMATLIYNQHIVGQYAKQHLPNYGVFDEHRYFKPGHESCVLRIHDIPVGIVICEDLWIPEPVQQAVSQGARLILSPNASPFEVDKQDKRMAVLAKRAKEAHVPIVYVNQVGGQDELLFDGGSMVCDQDGQITHCAGFFAEVITPVVMDVDAHTTHIPPVSFILPGKEEKIYKALTMGLRDYMDKNNFKSAILGLSGGIDSALVLALAVDALGKDRVEAVCMPSRYTAEMSITDAQAIANNLGVKCHVISIEPTFNALLQTLQPVFGDKVPDLTEENMQARCRAMILMAMSNKFGHLVLTTGNRSEMAVGYCTLYGDMVGGYAVLKDVPKMLVYALAAYRNSISPVIPENTILRAPTAELAPNQKDEDSLPPYPVLDQILYYYLCHNEDTAALIQRGFDEAWVKKIVRLIRQNEYKRYQSVVGPRIDHQSFGKAWRYPLTNGYKN